MRLERRRRATRLLAALEDDWGEVSRLASALEETRRRRESGAETDGWSRHPPVRIRGHDATTWLSEARTRRERIGYWLESVPAEGGTSDTA
ncbi:hypothetical protein [Haloterrigena salinisoli]|uniref:hypothetical protein n=1 Tax=Haloterrigena salinisoli TaxID=3132747 RepID=UPI0030D5FC59